MTVRGTDSSNSLHTIDYSGRQLKWNDAASIKELCDDISNKEELRILRLSGNTLGVEASESLMFALQSQPHLQQCHWADLYTGRLNNEIPKSLDLLGNGIVTAGAHLTHLDLSDNAFGPTGMEGLAPFLCHSDVLHTLIELRLNNNGLGTFGARALATALNNCITEAKTKKQEMHLETFVCGRNRLENEGAKDLAEVFSRLTTLKEIRLPQNGIQSPGIIALSENISSNTKLTTFDISDNIVTEVGAAVISKHFVDFKELKFLNLNDCILRNKGAECIASLLFNGLPSIEQLLLCYNEFQTSGASALINAAKKHKQLTELDLSGNNFGDEGLSQVEQLIKTFQMQNVLKEINDDQGSDVDDDDNHNEKNEKGISFQTNEFLSGLQEPSSNTATVSIQEFLMSPSGDSILQLGSNPEALILDVLDLSELDKFVETFVSLSKLLGESRVEVVSRAKCCIDSIFTSSIREKQLDLIMFANRILVLCGLIKSEDKKFKSNDETSSALVLGLTHVCSQNYFPRTTTAMFKAFFSLPKLQTRLKHCSEETDKLIAVLYSHS